MLESMRITKPFKVLARITELFRKGEYEGDNKIREVVELSLVIEGGFVEDIKTFLEKADCGGKQQTVTITVVP